MKNPQLLKIFLVFILSTAYIFSFSHFGASAYNQIFKDQGQFGDNTMIGSLDISGQSKREVSTVLTEAVDHWTRNTVLDITYKESKMTVDNGIFTFQMDKTIASLLSNKKNRAVVSVNTESLQEDLYDMSLALASASLDIDKLAKDLAVSAEFLTEGSKTLALENYIDGDTGEDEVVAEATVNLGNAAAAFKDLIPLIQPIKVDAETQFSLLQKMSELDGKKYNSDTLSRLATVIYGVILPTNFTIIERNISNQLPGYAELGFEAHVDSEIGHDLIFANTNDGSYRIELQVEGKKLKATLKGQSFLNSYEVKTTDEKRYTPKTIKQYSDELAPAAMQVKQEGKEGITVKVLRRIESSSGDLLETETLSEDFYAPIHRIEVFGLKLKEIISPPTDSDNEDESDTDSDNSGKDDETIDEDTEQEQGNEDKKLPGDESSNGNSSENNQDSQKDEQESNEDKGDSNQEAGGYPRYEEDPNVPQK
ncbi:VanW family protein [Peribacillus sp. NPDC097675]|uniref:VanW family protein n=1 Tax=Peribacillus sp. NPDC097675 TaxID=3390618 RepID=UPI003D0894AA